MKRWIALFVTLIVFALVAGCGSSTKTYTTDEGEEVEVKDKGDGDAEITVTTEDGEQTATINIDGDDDSGEMTITSEDGQTFTAKSGDKSEGAEKMGVPVYSNAKKESSTSLSTGDEETMHTYIYMTDDSVSDVQAFYKKNLKDYKKNLEMEVEGTKNVAISGKSDKGDDVQLTIAKEKEEPVVISIIVTEKK